MKALLALVLIVSMVVFVAPTLLDAGYPPWWAAVVLVVLAGLLGLSRWWGWGFVETVLKIGVPLAAACVVIITRSQGDLDAARRLAGPFLALVIALFGFYVAVSALRPRRRKRRDD